MIHFEKIAEGIDVSGVNAELASHPELWDAHTVRKTAPNTPHKQMSDIWVRYNDVSPYEDGTLPWSQFNDEHIPIWYPAWDLLPSLKPIVSDLLKQTEGWMLGGILITKIPPGCGIDPHVDRGWHVETYDKFYLQLQGAPGQVFGCEHRGVVEELEPKTGDIWLFDNRKLHWVRNISDSDRVTCIICIRTNKYDRKKLEDI